MPTQLVNSSEQLNDLSGGWIPTSVPITFVSADSPSYLVSVNYNVTGTFGVGMKMKLTHQSSTKNFIITQVTFTGTSTQLNLYGGADFTLNVTGAITNPSYSTQKSPFGFDTNPDKWTQSTITSDSPAITSPSAATWYGGAGLSPTGPSLSIPIGVWRVSYKIVIDISITLVAITAVGSRATLSTANNSESDVEWTTAVSVSLPVGTDTQRATYKEEKIINLASKTTYFMNMFTGNSGVSSMTMNTAGVFRNIIKAVCAYL